MNQHINNIIEQYNEQIKELNQKRLEQLKQIENSYQNKYNNFRNTLTDSITDVNSLIAFYRFVKNLTKNEQDHYYDDWIYDTIERKIILIQFDDILEFYKQNISCLENKRNNFLIEQLTYQLFNFHGLNNNIIRERCYKIFNIPYFFDKYVNNDSYRDYFTKIIDAIKEVNDLELCELILKNFLQGDIKISYMSTHVVRLMNILMENSKFDRVIENINRMTYKKCNIRMPSNTMIFQYINNINPKHLDIYNYELYYHILYQLSQCIMKEMDRIKNDVNYTQNYYIQLFNLCENLYNNIHKQRIKKKVSPLLIKSIRYTNKHKLKTNILPRDIIKKLLKLKCIES